MGNFVHLSQLIAHALSFIVFFFLVKAAFEAIIFPPMRERRERIRAEFDRIEQEKETVASLRQQYEGHLKRIEAEGRERIQQAVQEGQHVAGEIRDIARKEAQELLTRAREEIVIEHDKAREMLRNETVGLAMEIAERVLREELDPERHRKLVDGFLAEVEEAR
jgi:F-type H+-transporting ATPase subunit b